MRKYDIFNAETGEYLNTFSATSHVHARQIALTEMDALGILADFGFHERDVVAIVAASDSACDS